MVPVVDLSRRGRLVAATFAESAAAVSASGTYLLGDQTRSFEHEFGQWLDAPFVSAVSSGAAALQLALAALGIGDGDEVIVPAFTAVPTASAVCAVGAVPVPVDVQHDTANLDPTLVAAATTERTKAIIVVHLYGRPATIPQPGFDDGNDDGNGDGDRIAIIEDAAQAHGAIVHDGRSAATAYSFYPTKNLGGIGDGGAIVTSDAQLDEKVRRLRTHGMTEVYVHEQISQNFRMSEIEAAWLRVGLTRVHADNDRRRAIAAHYRAVAPDARWQRDHDRHVFHLCVLRTGDRDGFRRRMAARAVATAVHYPLAITQQPAYRRFVREPCPEAQAWARECVSVPCFPELTDGEVEDVAKAIASSAASR
ncbi:MAG: DegT/DnrJ/EryC1/StrS family aminotransferase [Ilumatobacteraceae bacterium]